MHKVHKRGISGEHMQVENEHDVIPMRMMENRFKDILSEKVDALTSELDQKIALVAQQRSCDTKIEEQTRKNIAELTRGLDERLGQMEDEMRITMSNADALSAKVDGMIKDTKTASNSEDKNFVTSDTFHAMLAKLTSRTLHVEEHVDEFRNYVDENFIDQDTFAEILDTKMASLAKALKIDVGNFLTDDAVRHAQCLTERTRKVIEEVDKKVQGSQTYMKSIKVLLDGRMNLLDEKLDYLYVMNSSQDCFGHSPKKKHKSG